LTVRVLGMNCAPRVAYLAVIEDGSLDPDAPERLQAPAGLETGDGLLECIREVKRVLGQARAEQVALLLPEANAAPSSERTELETLIRVAAAEEGTRVDLLSRPTVRSRLGLPRSGSLDTHIQLGAGPESGHYWRKGRALAVMAAKAVAP
jgi:hypothetical protein